MILFQIILILFFVFAALKVISRFRAGDLKNSGLIFWLLFWFLAAAIVIWPDTTFYFSKLLGIARGADLVVYAGLALLFFLVFKITVRLERIEKNITKIVREKTLNDK